MENIIQKIYDYTLEEIMGDRFGRYFRRDAGTTISRGTDPHWKKYKLWLWPLYPKVRYFPNKPCTIQADLV